MNKPIKKMDMSTASSDNKECHFNHCPSRVDILGVGISAITMREALCHIQAWIAARSAHYVCCAPAHAVMECHDHPELKSIYNQSGLTTPDGMAIVWLCRLLGFRSVERVYGPDLLLAVCQDGIENGTQHYFYGGAPGVAEALIEKLVGRFPGLRVAGYFSPPFRPLSPDEDQTIVNQIRAAGPDIIWVGIGSPRQEVWMAEHVNHLNVPVLVGVGAAFDFLSGRKVQAPRWMQRSGLEWFFRLLSEPRRLWQRYVINYPRFVFLVLVQLFLQIFKKS